MLKVSVEVDKQELKKLYIEKVEEALKEFDAELVFWDRQELLRRTCMSWPFIQEQFFFHPDFPKKKVGNKWYFPARETRNFLVEWLMSK
ncbi:group-specific protein [Paenibacillus yanchengensis]|uniref:Group-specific protein n=1 Tax=Paenibacillus yanchengensis TaxID=2035833 RepID=A0ABW4YRT5_9BACL